MSGSSDTYSRYLVRVEELRQSLKLIDYILINLLNNFNGLNAPNSQNYSNLLNHKDKMYYDMEALISHFKQYSSKNKYNPVGSIYVAVESPKGEFGVHLLGSNTNKPFRCKIRTPGYYHLQSISGVVSTMLLADVVAFIGSIDVVFGEIDR